MPKRHDDFATDTRPGGKDHTYKSHCYGWAKWCRIHRYSDWGNGIQTWEWYPADFGVPDTYFTWPDGKRGIKFKTVTVYCGPGAFYPARPKFCLVCGAKLVGREGYCPTRAEQGTCP